MLFFSTFFLLRLAYVVFATFFHAGFIMLLLFLLGRCYTHCVLNVRLM